MFRQRNTWRDLIKKQIKEICSELQQNDTDRSHSVDPSLFMKVINKRIEVPHQLRDHTNMLYDYVLSFQDERSGKICYKEMASDLQAFNFDKETNEGILPRSAHSISDGAYSIAGVAPKRNVFNDDYLVVNSKQVPQNQVELIEKRLVKVNRFIKDKFVN